MLSHLVLGALNTSLDWRSLSMRSSLRRTCWVFGSCRFQCLFYLMQHTKRRFTKSIKSSFRTPDHVHAQEICRPSWNMSESGCFRRSAVQTRRDATQSQISGPSVSLSELLMRLDMREVFGVKEKTSGSWRSNNSCGLFFFLQVKPEIRENVTSSETEKSLWHDTDVFRSLTEVKVLTPHCGVDSVSLWDANVLSSFGLSDCGEEDLNAALQLRLVWQWTGRWQETVKKICRRCLNVRMWSSERRRRRKRRRRSW